MSFALTDFGRAEYARLLDGFLEAGYGPLDFPGAHALPRTDEPWLVLRHDIDFCALAARDMALVEAAKGVFSTYFFMLRTPFYNLLTAENTAAVREIIAAGHRLGLHFDRTAYSASRTPEEMAEAIRKEAGILENWFGAEVKVTSYHRPDAREVEGRAEDSHPLLNTYMEAFTRRIAYFSDSQGAFRFGHPFASAAFEQRRAIQLLIHPIWWGEEACSPLERLKRFTAGRGERQEEDAARNCKVFRVGRWAHITD